MLTTACDQIRASLPPRKDPRWAVALLLSLYLLAGLTLLGFNRQPIQALAVIGFAGVSDMALHWLLRQRQLIFPLSGIITGIGLSILLNYGHGSWLALVAVWVAIASKYVITAGGRHIYNPSLIAIVACLFFSGDMIAPAPAYQWGGTLAISIFIATAAIMLFMLRIRRSWLVISFLLSYFACTALRAWLTRHHVPMEVIFVGALSSPAFYLFTFFMITDPRSSPDSPRLQVLAGVAIAVIDLLLHRAMLLNTQFYAAFFVQSSMFVLFRLRTHLGQPWAAHGAAFKSWGRKAVVVAGGMGLMLPLVMGPLRLSSPDPGFSLARIAPEQSGISAQPGDVLQQVDPRIAHIGKWLLSIGDAAAVADFDGDGLPDLFLTNSLKASADRGALYRNQGDFSFARVPLPVLDAAMAAPRQYGLPSDALFFDHGGDGDMDLLIIMGYGAPILLQNQLAETGAASFADITADAGLADEHLASITATVLDVNRDGQMDLIIGNTAAAYLPGYDVPQKFSLFALPEAEYEGDRRMFDFMHRSWHDAANGGENLLFLGHADGRFRKQDAAAWGLGGTRWTMDIGTGDLNNDGWTDLYMANDFGPDRLYLNQQGKGFASIRGHVATSLGRDTYKGMNASIGDIDNNGFADIYVSNVHAPLQAEGSLLWMNDGQLTHAGARAMQDQAWKRGALNPNRFGWGGAMGDIDLDGDLDILQANGHIDDAYDGTSGPCEDYWYYNDKIALTAPDIHGMADEWADLRGRCIFPHQADRVYLNDNGRFVDVAAMVGLTEKLGSRGMALADFDNDGDADVLITHQTAPPSLYRNDLARAHGWIGLRLTGTSQTCPTDAPGSRISILDKGKAVQWRETQASNGLSAQSDPRLLFGLGAYGADKVALRINWCGGEAQDLQLAPNRYHHLIQPPTPPRHAANRLITRGVE